jgi:cytochrome c-type biogenesis protein CcmH/NrfG
MSANQQSAIAALNSVRPIAERLDRGRDGEDRAADILELWEGTETALRALMGGSSLGGQALIRELRQRELISLGQAYALLEFLGARDRANRTSYKSTPSDVDAAREGFRQLDTGLQQGTIDGIVSAYDSSATPAAKASTTVPRAVPPAAAPPASTPVATAPADSSPRVPFMSGKNRWLLPAILAVLVLGGLAYFLLGRSPDSTMSKGVDLMKSGRREAARTEFAAVARDNPNLASPHIFLARLSREEGDLGTARMEAEKAVRLDPTNAVALREMGLVLFTSRQYDLSRNFFIRALKANPDDAPSSGYLGCALIRMGRSAEGNKFLSRAGSGVWSSCAQLPAGTQTPTP